jgi:hypothetical protein
MKLLRAICFGARAKRLGPLKGLAWLGRRGPEHGKTRRLCYAEFRSTLSLGGAWWGQI